jgi:hypothetical protein
MAGYTRQDTNDNIATGKVINASDFDNEYNSLQSAFNNASGHKHDGTAAEGARITVIGPSGKFSTDANAFYPTNTATVGLGKTSFVFKDLHIDNIVADGNTISTITSGNLIVNPYTYKLEVKGGTVGGNTSGMIQLNCENNSHGQTIQAQPHSTTTTNTMLLPQGASSTLVSLVSTDTLQNKTLTTPVFSGISTTASGNLQVKPATNILEVQGDGSSVEGQIKLNCHANSHGQTIKAQPHSTSTTNTMLLPQGASSTLVSLVSADTLTNKIIDVDNNTLSNVEVDNLKAGVLDTDLTAVSAGDTTLASAKAIKTYVDAQVSGISADITEVTAGTGLTGGGASGAVTLNVIGGTGITANANDIAIDNTVATLTGSQTLASKTLTLPQINDTSSDHQYVFAVSELAADRTVTLPLLAGNDEFVFKDHTQTLSNKTIQYSYLLAPRLGGSGGTNQDLFNSHGARLLGWGDAGANAVNYVNIGNADASPSGNAQVGVSAAGSDGDVILNLSGKGAWTQTSDSFYAMQYREGVAALNASGSTNVDMQYYNVFEVTLTGTATLAFTNFPTEHLGVNKDNVFGFTIKVKQNSSGNFSVTWPAAIKWAGGTAPTLTGTANSIDVFTFFSVDGGTNIYGFTAGLNLS